MDTTQYAVAAFVIIGLVNGLNFAVEGKWGSFALFVAAVLFGLVFGFVHWLGLPNAETGLLVAIASSGVYKVSQKLGGE